ncbi:MAG: hypothetical protein ACXWL2_03660 [Candidatus Chromulinivorax sp.]
MNKKQLFLLLNLLLSTSFLLPMDENTTPSNSAPRKSSFKQPGSPRKSNTIKFFPYINLILIANRTEYKNADLTKRIWYTKEEGKAITNHIKTLKSTSNELIDELAITDAQKEQIKNEKQIVENLEAQKKSREEKAAHIENMFRQIEEQKYQDRQKKRQKKDVENLVQRFLGIQF